MKLVCRRRVSWFECIPVTDADGQVRMTVSGEASWGHRMCVCDGATPIVTVKQTWFSKKLGLYVDGVCQGTVWVKRKLFRNALQVTFRDWRVDRDDAQNMLAIVRSDGKEIAHGIWTVRDFHERYTIELHDEEEAFAVIALLQAIDLCT